MILETWIGVLLLILIAILGGIGLIGWMISDQRYEEAMKENKALIKENTKLKSKLDVARLYIDAEGMK